MSILLIRHAFTTSWEGREHEIEPYPLQALHVGHAASERGRRHGDVEHGVLPAGQSSGLIHEIKSAREVVQDMVAEAITALGRLLEPL